MLQNESKFIVKYEVYIYKGASVGKIDAAIGTGVFEGRTALEIIQAEGLNPEEGRIPVGGTAYVTCGYGGKIAIRYFFEDLHADYTDELRNFQVLDVIKFLQPSETEIEKIIERKKEAEKLEQELNNKKFDVERLISINPTVVITEMDRKYSVQYVVDGIVYIILNPKICSSLP